MLLELYIIFQIATIASFFLAFFFRHEILWFVSFMLSGFLMLNSYSIEIMMMQATNTSFGPGIVDVLVSKPYPYLMGINLLFFALSLLMGMFDMFDKYGQKAIEERIEKEDTKTINIVNETDRLSPVVINVPQNVTSTNKKRGRPCKIHKI